MATITPSSVATADVRAQVYAWAGFAASADVGAAVQVPGYRDRSVQISGTFAGSIEITIEGSNDGANYVALTDPQGNAIVKTAAAIEAISEPTRYIRPRASAGSGGAAVTVTLFFGGNA
ncbi:MAG TPA: hypothetical protein DCZ11_01705 [Gammaproteobacteria bacterium]|nr:hypothetical protein [Gammaproteobacteria bacterium]MCH77140.1 hypothetical protein [Gammaproteobacteria bacterium]